MDTPLQDVIAFYRKHQRVDDAWVARWGAGGGLDQASARAWQAEEDPRPMLRLGPRWSTPAALSLLAVDLARTALPHVPERLRAEAARALDQEEGWAGGREPAPPEGWSAFAERFNEDETDDDDAILALNAVRSAARVPDHPTALDYVAAPLFDLAALAASAESPGDPGRRSEQEIDQFDALAAERVSKPMVERIRARLPAPTGAALEAALRAGG